LELKPSDSSTLRHFVPHRVAALFHAPDDCHPYNGAPEGQFRKFLRKNRSKSFEPLVEHLVKTKDITSFQRLIYLGLERSDLLFRLIRVISKREGSDEILQKAISMRLMGATPYPTLTSPFALPSTRNDFWATRNERRPSKTLSIESTKSRPSGRPFQKTSSLTNCLEFSVN
jgi:hypothetical protein